MPQYGFQGGMAGNAIQEFLMQREMQQRQQMLDQLMQQRQEQERQRQDADQTLRSEDLDLRRQQERRIGAEQTATRERMEDERSFRRANTIAENALPEDTVDEQTRALLTKQGFGGQVRKVPGIVSQGPMIEEESEANGYIPTYGTEQTPDQFTMRGGSKYLNARAAEDARASVADQNRTAATERANADRDMKELIARLAASGSAESRALANELTRIQIQAAGDKLETAQTERGKSVDAAKSATENALALAIRLATHPGLGKATGAYEMRGFTQEATNFNAIRDQLVAALALPNLGALKGPLSDKDILFVKQLATRLENRKMDDAETLTAIAEAKTFLQDKLAATPTPAGGGAQEYDYIPGRGLVPRR